MKHVFTTLGVAILFAIAVSAPGSAQAATYSYGGSSYAAASYSSSGTNADLYAQIQALIVKLTQLQAQVAAMQSVTVNYPQNNQQCYPSGHGTQYCYTYTTQYPSVTQGGSRLESIDVELEDDFARVHIDYTSGREQELIFDAETREEVIEFLIDETDESRSQILAVIDWNGDFDNDNDNDDADDIDSIDVDINNGDADVRVEYDDGDTDRFTIENETNHNDIIDEIADELDIDEDDVRDLIDFDNNNSNNDEDVDEIDVTIFEDDEEAEAIVRFEDGDTDHYDFNTDDEDDIIEELADILDMDEDDVEDLTDFEYED